MYTRNNDEIRKTSHFRSELLTFTLHLRHFFYLYKFILCNNITLGMNTDLLNTLSCENTDPSQLKYVLWCQCQQSKHRVI